MGVLALPCAVAASGQVAWAAPIGRFTRVVPVVEVSRERRAWVPARPRATFYYNTLLRSGKTGAASLLFTNGTEAKMGPSSYLKIERSSSPTPTLILRVARAFSQVLVHPRGKTEVHTNAAIAAARGTQFVVRNTDERTTEIFVTEGSVDFYNGLGSVQVNAGQSSEASVGRAPSPPRAFDVTGRFDWAASVDGLPLAFPAGPNDPPALRDALALASAAEQRAALQVLAQAPGAEGARALSALGLVELRAGNLDASLKYLGEAIASDGRLATPRSLLSIALLSQNQVARAVEEARQGVALTEQQAALHAGPERTLAHSSLAHALFFAGRSGEALQEAQRALSFSGGESDPLSPLALLVQGRVFLARNRPDQALEAFAQASALAPGLFLAQREVGSSYASRGQLPRAEKALQQAIEMNPDDARSHALLGDVLARQGRQADSRREFDRALALEPRNGLVRALLAQALIEEGQLQEGQEQLELAQANDPDVGLVLVRLSEEALYRQDLGAAQAFARRGVALLPQSAPAHYQLGRVFWEQGRITNAEAEFRQAVILDQNFDEARYALGLARGRTERGLFSLLQVNGAGQRTVGSAGSALSELDLQTPGANDLFQGQTGSIMAVRPATRAFGDFQFDGALGSRSREGGLSFLRQSQDRLSLVGATVERQGDDGARSNADRTFDRAEILLGRKNAGDASGGFFQGSFEQSRAGGNSGFLPELIVPNQRENYRLPRILAGYNFQKRAGVRTRMLVQGQSLDRDESDRDDPLYDSQLNDRSANLEVRHDRRLGERNQLSAGLAWGRRTRDVNVIIPETPQLPPGFTQIKSRIQQAQAWARGTFSLSPRLSLIGEMRLLDVEYDTARQSGFQGAPPFSGSGTSGFTTGVPLFVAAYQLNSSSAFRLRARRVLASVRDFELLLPNDPFSIALEDLPSASVVANGSSGRSFEAEYDHTFSNSALLRLSVAQQDIVDSSDATSARIDRTRSQVLRASYSAPLGRNLSLFSAVDLIHARAFSTGAPPQRAGLLPGVTVAGGLQYLNPKGLFADLLGTYSSSNSYTDTQGNDYRSGSFGVVSARIGKRTGLRSSYYVEARNIFDKQYARFGTLQAGRQIRVGFLSRF